MRFIKLTPSFAQEWDRLVHASDDAWLYHLYAWLEMTEKIWDLEAQSFLVEYQGDLIGIVPLQMNKKNKSLKSIAMGTGGAALKNGLPADIRQKVLKSIYQHMEDIGRLNGSPGIEIYVPPLAEFALNDRWHVNPLVNFSYSDVSTHTFIADLKKDEGEIFNALSKSAKDQIKEAEKKGYKIREVHDVDEYYQVHEETYSRTGAQPFPKEYFEDIYKNVCKNGHGAILEVSGSDGHAAAFQTIALFKKKALYWTGCSRTAHLDSGVNYFLQYQAMLWAKKQGAEWFENGEAFPDVREGKLSGLTSFKGKFGGQLHRFYKGKLLLKAAPEESVHKKWFKSTLLLLQPVLGERSTGFIRDKSAKIYRFFAQIYRLINSRHMIHFIMPYWGLKEFSTGLFYKEALDDNAPELLIDQFRRRLNAGGLIVPTSSARTALELALKVLRQQYPHKSKVIIPSYSCQGLFDPIVNAGLVPVFADIEENLNISKDSVRRILKEIDALAVVVPHLGGCKAEIEEIAGMAREKGAIVIEDVCQALGAEGLGTAHAMSIFSFGIGKNLMATAGGVLHSNILKEEIGKEALELKNENTALVKKRFRDGLFKYFLKWGKDNRSPSAYQYNRMHPLDARLVSLQLDKLEMIVRLRRQNARKIADCLYKTNVKFFIPRDKNHIYTKLSVVFERLDECNTFRQVLTKAGVEIEEMYMPLHLRNLAVDSLVQTDLTHTERTYKKVFNIPVRPQLNSRQMETIRRAIENVNA